MAKLARHSMRTPFRKRVSIDFGDVSRTRQEFADDADVNNIMKRFQKTGMFPVPAGQAQYLDLTDMPDFQTAMDLMIVADQAFMRLPASVRKEFDNDPQKFVAFAEDEKNLDKMREWGLAPPPEAPPEPQLVKVVEEPPPSP